MAPVDAAQLAVKPLALMLVAAAAIGVAGAVAPPDDELEPEDELLLEELLDEDDELLDEEELEEELELLEELEDEELDEVPPFTTRAAALLVTLPALLVTTTV